MESKKNIGKVFFNSIIYTISGLLLKCCSFFLLPLYTAYLTTNDYGITSIVTGFTNTMSFIVSFSLSSAISRFFVDYKDEPQILKRFYGTIVTFVFMSGLVFAGGLFSARDLLCKYIFKGIDFFPIILIAIIHLIFVCEHGIYDAILRSQQKSVKCSIISIVTFFAIFVCNIIFVVMLNLGALGSILALFVVYVLYTMYFIVDMISRREIYFCIDKVLLKSALKYSIPMIPHNISTLIASLISKIFIGNNWTIAEVGIYSIACQFGDISDGIQGYVNQAYSPWLFEKLHNKDDGYKLNIRQVINLLCTAIGLFMVCLALFSQDAIILLLNRTFVDAWRYVPLITGVYAIKTIYYFYISVLFYYKKASRLIFISTFTGSFINILLSVWWIPLWGVYGSILADAFAMFIRVAIVVFISKQFEDVGIKLRDFVFNVLRTLLFIAAGLVFSYLVTEDTFSLANLIYKICVVFIYVLVAVYPYRKQVRLYMNRIKNKVFKH